MNRLMALQDELEQPPVDEAEVDEDDLEDEEEYTPAGGQRRSGVLLAAATSRSGRARSLALARPIAYRVPGTVPLVVQPSSMSGWAASTAMLLSWRERQSMGIEDALGRLGGSFLDSFRRNTGLPVAEKANFLATAGLAATPPMRYTPEDWELLLRENGPLWVMGDDRTGQLFAPSSRIVVGIKGSGRAENTTVDIIDPATGRQTSERLSRMLKRFGRPDARGKRTRLQVVHLAQGAPNDTPRVEAAPPALAPPPPPPVDAPPQPVFAVPPPTLTSSPPTNGGAPAVAQAYGMAARPGYARAYDGGAGVAVAVAGMTYSIVKDAVVSTSSDITYDLFKMDGKKHPHNDPAWDQKGQWKAGTVRVRNGFSTAGGDEQSVEFEVGVQWNGHSAGNITITPRKTEDAWGWKLHVTENIIPREDREANDVAAIEVKFIFRHYSWAHDDQIYQESLILFGNGMIERRGEWTQSGGM